MMIANGGVMRTRKKVPKTLKRLEVEIQKTLNKNKNTSVMMMKVMKVPMTIPLRLNTVN